MRHAAPYLCVFVLKSHGGPKRLFCRVKWNGSKNILDMSVGFAIDPDRWDAAYGLCQPKSFHGPHRIPASVINAEIARYRTAVDNLFAGYAKLTVTPSKERVRRELTEALHVEQSPAREMVSIFDEFMREESLENSWTEATTKKLKTTRAHLLDFGKFVSMDDFTRENLQEYLRYLVDERKLSNATTQRALRCLRWFCNWAFRKGYLESKDYDRFRPKLTAVPKPVVFLTWEELMSVWNSEPAAENLRNARDIFCFGAFTSLRYSDLMALRWGDVFDDHIEVVTQKTADPLRIELNDWAKAVLAKYERRAPGEKVFPHYENCPLNRLLHVLAKDCGLTAPVTITRFEGSKRTSATYEKWEVIGTHAARRTFICNALSLGVPPTVVMQWTGHSDYKAMKPYIAVSDQTKKSEMEKFNRALNRAPLLQPIENQ